MHNKNHRNERDIKYIITRATRYVAVERRPSAGAVRQLHRHDGTEHEEECLRGGLPRQIQCRCKSPSKSNATEIVCRIVIAK